MEKNSQKLSSKSDSSSTHVDLMLTKSKLWNFAYCIMEPLTFGILGASNKYLKHSAGGT